MPEFPPLLRGTLAAEPRVAAIAEATAGCDGGLIFWRGGDVLEAAVVFAPDVPLLQAAQMLPLTGLALRDGLGAIGPPELPIHLTWDGRIMLNGAEAGAVTLIAPKGSTDAIPDWIVAHLLIRFVPVEEHDRTALWSEGAGDITPDELVEAWARHMLHRLSVWQDDGAKSLHTDLTGCAWEAESKAEGFLGYDETLGRLRRDGETVKLDPLTDLLETP
ncbi:Biotin/lipoate A/B protein ligase family protein [Jannaschia faecimaris]|uniref:Biotin/lipoate A/B protein ligase family protein n=1 Tax=Jannaschia faecimaris TaxID=1244108 RepID=A0A1H3JLT1_9RHOB|nr:biotin/lipoate--protein ligase family protein [Jannaschia faecimaris]SDY40950.1 Biotin/lipoate A/B protein ligase family protein [Jannaschia faecimaris]